MAGQRDASPSRREQREASEQRQRRIVIGVIVGLVGVALVVVAGLYVTQYRAPRAHVLTVEGRDYNAAFVARRGVYLALFETGFRDQGSTPLAETVVELLIDEAVLRAAAPELVGAVGDAEVEDDLMGRFGLTQVEGRAAFAELLQTRIQASGLSRDEFYELAATSLLRSLLTDQFTEAVDPSASQVRLSRIRLVERAEAEEIRELLTEGGDFAELALERSADSAHQLDGGDLGWLIVAELEPEVAEVVAELEPDELAPVLESGIFFDLYLLVEREPERELSAAQVAAQVAERLEAWLDEGRAGAGAVSDLSVRESDWIGTRIVGDVSNALGG